MARRRQASPATEALGTVPGRLARRCDARIVARFDATVAALEGHPHYRTAASCLAEALTTWCARQEQAHHGGEPFPPARATANNGGKPARGADGGGAA